jgi:hypothetical protein
MKQSLIGVGIAVIGLVLIRYSEPLARTSKAINDQLGGLTFPIKWGSKVNQFAGLLLIISGLLLAFHLMRLPWKQL